MALPRKPLTVADTSDLHPDVLIALKTGKLPAGARRSEDESADQPDTSRASEQERFRQLYHDMVEERITDWLDDHPANGRSIPPEERERIEDYCRSHVQHQWAAHLRRLMDDDELL